jgi:aspartokinase/homoserine dehydrogenase 1
LLKVIKYGGTSVSHSYTLANILSNIKNNKHHKIIVVCSALTTVTNNLVTINNLVINKKVAAIKQIISKLKKQHYNLIKQSFNISQQQNVKSKLLLVFKQLSACINKTLDNPTLIKFTANEILSFGEILSCTIITHYLLQYKINAKLVDARDLIVTESLDGHIVDFTTTKNNIQQWYSSVNYVPIVTGFIARTKNKDIANLGRGGSDYTATIIGGILNANDIEIWSDVDGVLTANPQHFKFAKPVNTLSYKQAIELATFGAKIIYPPAILPLLDTKISLSIKNTFNPTHQGTIITDKRIRNSIKAISSQPQVSMITITSCKQQGLSVIKKRLANLQINLPFLLTDTCINEYALSLFTIDDNIHQLIKALNTEFISELNNKSIKIQINKTYCWLSLIGYTANQSKLIQQISSILTAHQINICSIQYNVLAINMVLILKRKDFVIALQVLHKELIE